MAVFNAAFPILPGKVEAARAFGTETMGARSAQFAEYQKRRDVTRETWSVQQTPDGAAFSVVWIESPDPEKAIAVAAGDPSEFGVWFRARVKEINGIDLDDPGQPLPPAPEVTLDWRP
jgi:hypothetical protein